MDCKAANCPLAVEMLVKLVALVFTSSIAVEVLDFDVVLGVQPGLTLLVAIEGLVLRLDKVNLRKSAASIHEACKLFLPVDCFHRCRPP